MLYSQPVPFGRGVRDVSVRKQFHGPIWIVDGVDVGYKEISADDLGSRNPRVLIASALDGINAEDIIDFRVIKGEEGQIRYGERGKDGVMVVTTRLHPMAQHLMKIDGHTLYDISAPVHTREHIIARIIQMRQYDERKRPNLIKTSRLCELDNNASLLEETGIQFMPFMWTGKLSDRGSWHEARVTIGQVRLSGSDRAEVDICYQDDGDRRFPYTLLLELADNQWMIDDVRWTGFGNTLQSQEAEESYRSEAEFFSKTGSVDEIFERIRWRTQYDLPEDRRYGNAEKELKAMRKMHYLFKMHPKYTPELGAQVSHIINDYEAAARHLGHIPARRVGVP